MAIIVSDEPTELVRKLRIQVGDEWIAHDFGRKVARAYARERLLSMADALLPKDTNHGH